MHVRLSVEVPGVEPSEARSWWRDFRPGHDDHRFIPGTRRTVRPAQGEAQVLEDEARPLGIPVFREHLLARPTATGVAFEGENTFSTFSGQYDLVRGLQGTEVRLDADVRLKRRWAWAEAVARPVARAVLKADLEGHVRDMRRELAAP